jgi:hypothetical protein
LRQFIAHRLPYCRLALESLECRRLLIAQIHAGHHILIPDLPGQTVSVLVTDADRISGVNFRAQLGDGSGPAREPEFTGLNLNGTIFQSLSTILLGGPVENSSLLQASVVLQNESEWVSAPGILGRFDIDTTGIDAGQFELRLAQTQIGADTDLVGDPAMVLNGSISIAEAGDANLDGVFNSNDLVVVFQEGQYEDDVPGNSSWSQGDWDGDREFSTSDLVAAFQAGRYQASATAPSVERSGLIAGRSESLAVLDALYADDRFDGPARRRFWDVE